MGKGSKEQKKSYVRLLSTNLKKWTPHPSEAHYVDEDPTIEGLEGLGRSVMFLLCRNRQRLLSQSWAYWVRNAGVVHDYTADVIAILSREIGVDEYRTELEIEVMHKWALQQYQKDPTGLAASIAQCTSRNVIVDVFQQCRLEVYNPRDVVIFQGILPAEEDGHFTLLEGSCDVINLQEGSVSAIKLTEYAKRSRFESAKQLLFHAPVQATMLPPSGFGELSCMTGVKRHASIRAGQDGASFLVVPQKIMRSCIEYKRTQSAGIPGSSPSEAIELFRQLGLAAKISPQDLSRAATHMIKRTLSLGDVLYYKHQPASAIYLIVSGDLILDTGEPVGVTAASGQSPAQLAEKHAFLSSVPEYCFHMSSGGIVGDEGAIGMKSYYESTVAVASEVAVIFEAKKFAYAFLSERIRTMRYAALTYKELPRWSVPIPFAEMNNIYGSLNSLRKCIAFSRPLRGTVDNPYLLDSDSAPSFTTPAQRARQQEAEEARNRQEARERRIALKNAGKSSSRSKSRSLRSRGSKDAPSSNSHISLTASLSQSLAQSIGDDESTFSRLSGLALMALKTLNATCKKRASEKLKLHARENILADSVVTMANKKGATLPAATEEPAEFHDQTQGVDQTPAKTPGTACTGHLHSETTRASSAKLKSGSHAALLEARLQRNVEAYTLRNKSNLVEEEEDDGPRVTLAAASNMLGMLASAAGTAMSEGGSGEGGEEEQGESKDEGADEEAAAAAVQADEEKSEDQSQVSQAVHSYASSTGVDAHERKAELLSRSRIAQYFAYLDRTKGDALAGVTNTVTVTITVESALEDAAKEEAELDTQNVTTTGGASAMSKRVVITASSNPPKAEIYWRSPSPTSRFSHDPLLASPKSRTTVKSSPELKTSPLWPKRDWKYVNTYTGADTDTEANAPAVIIAAHTNTITITSTMTMTNTNTNTSTNKGAAALTSLQFDPRTFRERIKQAPSSGYGQVRLVGAEAAIAQALEERQNFQRLTAPNTRRIFLLDWQLAQQTAHLQLLTASGKTDSKAEAKTDTRSGSKAGGKQFEASPEKTNEAAANLPHASMPQDDDDCSVLSSPEPNANTNSHTNTKINTDADADADADAKLILDINEPAAFLRLLEDKSFSVRSQYRPVNVWRTRTMRVTPNATEVQEEGSIWFRRKVASMGLTDEALKKTLPSRFDLKARKGTASGDQQQSEGQGQVRASASISSHDASLMRSPGGAQSIRDESRSQTGNIAERRHSESVSSQTLQQRSENGSVSGQGPNDVNVQDFDDADDADVDGEGEGEGDEGGHDSVEKDSGEENSLSLLPPADMEPTGNGATTLSEQPQSGSSPRATEGQSTTQPSTNQADGPPDTPATPNSPINTATSSAAQRTIPGSTSLSRSPSRNTVRGTVIAPVLEPSTLKEPSKALRIFRDTLEQEYTSRRFLDGRKQHDSTTKYKLEPPAFTLIDDTGDARKVLERAQRAATEHLLQALLPPGVVLNQFGAVKRSSPKKRSTGQFPSETTHGGEAAFSPSPSSPSPYSSRSPSRSGSLASTGSASTDRRDKELNEWQKFSVEVSVKNKNGPTASLPVLAGVSSDPAEPRVKKSSLNFANRLAKLPGSEEEGREREPETYLTVYTRQFSSKQKSKSRLY